jgi:hypothetical protein
MRKPDQVLANGEEFRVAPDGGVVAVGPQRIGPHIDHAALGQRHNARHGDTTAIATAMTNIATTNGIAFTQSNWDAPP